MYFSFLASFYELKHFFILNFLELHFLQNCVVIILDKFIQLTIIYIPYKFLLIGSYESAAQTWP